MRASVLRNIRFKGLDTPGSDFLKHRLVKYKGKGANYDKDGYVISMYIDFEVRHHSSRVSTQASNYKTSFVFDSYKLKTDIHFNHSIWGTWPNASGEKYRF